MHWGCWLSAQESRPVSLSLRMKVNRRMACDLIFRVQEPYVGGLTGSVPFSLEEYLPKLGLLI